MRKKHISFTIPLPDRLFDLLHKIKRAALVRRGVDPDLPNLAGDRDIEWSWVASHMPEGPGQALDFGSGNSFLGLIAAMRGFSVIALDLLEVRRPYVYPGLRFERGDIMDMPFAESHFDLVINCSTVEHVGLVGRYGVSRDRHDGDLEAMARLWRLMKDDGVMLLTVPVGRDAVFPPLQRVYGAERLPLLIRDYTLESSSFWTKDGENRWVPCPEEEALCFEARASSNPRHSCYGLGCFVLRKPTGG